MKEVINSYNISFRNKTFVTKVFLSIWLLIFSLFLNYYAGVHATAEASNPVTDVILSNTRVYDTDGVFIYGPIIFWVLVVAFAFVKPKRIPFTFESASLFIVIRSVFVNLTHIAPFPARTILPPENIIRLFTFGGDLFFSGHTGLPFLAALIFWDNKMLRYLFIGASIIFGAVALLGHLHYTIDVASAYFITYSIYILSTKIFKKDFELFHS